MEVSLYHDSIIGASLDPVGDFKRNNTVSGRRSKQKVASAMERARSRQKTLRVLHSEV